jgi:uncharacterized protein YkwD
MCNVYTAVKGQAEFVSRPNLEYKIINGKFSHKGAHTSQFAGLINRDANSGWELFQIVDNATDTFGPTQYTAIMVREKR